MPTQPTKTFPNHWKINASFSGSCWNVLRMFWKRPKSSKSTQNHLIQPPRCPFRPPRRHVVCSGSKSVSPWHTSVCPESNYSIENSRKYHWRNENNDRKKRWFPPNKALERKTSLTAPLKLIEMQPEICLETWNTSKRNCVSFPRNLKK